MPFMQEILQTELKPACRRHLQAGRFIRFEAHRGVGVEVLSGAFAGTVLVIGLRTDHRAVVAAQTQGRHAQPDAERLGPAGEFPADAGICRHAARDGQRPVAGLAPGPASSAARAYRSPPWRTKRKATGYQRLAALLVMMDEVQRRRLEAREGHIERIAAELGVRHGIFVFVAGLCPCGRAPRRRDTASRSRGRSYRSIPPAASSRVVPRIWNFV